MRHQLQYLLYTLVRNAIQNPRHCGVISNAVDMIYPTAATLRRTTPTFPECFTLFLEHGLMQLISIKFFLLLLFVANLMTVRGFVFPIEVKYRSGTGPAHVSPNLTVLD